MDNINNFFDIICRNNEDELSEYLLAKGKSPKPICPIMFFCEDIIENNDQEK